MTRPFPRILRTHQWEPTVTDVSIPTRTILTDADGNEYVGDGEPVVLHGWDVQRANSGEATFNAAGTLTQTQLYQAFAPVDSWPYVQKNDTLVTNLTNGETYRIVDFSYWGSHVRVFMVKTS